MNYNSRKVERNPYRTALIRKMPLLWLSLALLIGIFSAFHVRANSRLLLSAAGLALLATILYARSRKDKLPASIWARQLLTLLVLAFFLLGMARFEAAQKAFTASDLAFYNDGPERVAITGTIVEPPLRKDAYDELRLRVEQIEWPALDEEPLSVEGGLLVRTDAQRDWAYGDRVLLRGFLESAPEFEDFSYRAYLSRQGIDSLMAFAEAIRLEQGQGQPLLGALFSWRAEALLTLKELFPEPEAALLAGILLGDESGLSAGLKEDFNITGARHVIAISGFNITIIAGILIALFRRLLGPSRGSWLAILGIAGYTLLVGADAAVVRAAIMGTLALLARRSGRRQAGLLTLSLAAALMALANPEIIWDVGFQLSFAATLGIVLYAEPLTYFGEDLLRRRFNEEFARRMRAPLAEFFLLTIAAQITTLPLILYHFHRLSWVSLPTNLLILPVQAALMLSSGLALLLAMVFFPLGQLLAWLAWPFAAYTIRVVELFAAPAWASVAIGELSAAFIVAYYALLALFTFSPASLSAKQVFRKPIFIAFAMSMAALWLWLNALAAPSGELQISLLDVGAGEAILVTTPTGRHILINGGESALALGEELGRALPRAHQALDWLIVAGVANEQIAALPDALERLAPAQIAWSGKPSASYAARRLRQMANALDTPMTFLSAGQRFDLGDGAQISVLGSTERGALLLLEYEDFRFLLPIGLDLELIKQLDWGKAIGKINGMLLSDAGEPELNPALWLDSLAPDFLLISADGLDRDAYQFESAQLLESSPNLLTTMAQGWIRISTDGQSFRLETGRR